MRDTPSRRAMHVKEPPKRPLRNKTPFSPQSLPPRRDNHRAPRMALCFRLLGGGGGFSVHLGFQIAWSAAGCLLPPDGLFCVRRLAPPPVSDCLGRFYGYVPPSIKKEGTCITLPRSDCFFVPSKGRFWYCDDPAFPPGVFRGGVLDDAAPGGWAVAPCGYNISRRWVGNASAALDGEWTNNATAAGDDGYYDYFLAASGYTWRNAEVVLAGRAGARHGRISLSAPRQLTLKTERPRATRAARRSRSLSCLGASPLRHVRPRAARHVRRRERRLGADARARDGERARLGPPARGLLDVVRVPLLRARHHLLRVRHRPAARPVVCFDLI